MDVCNSATVHIVLLAPREFVRFIIRKSLLLHNELASIGSEVISSCSPADLYEEKERYVLFVSADIHRGGRLHDRPKEHLHRRLTVSMIMHNNIYVPVHDNYFMHWIALHNTVLYKNYYSTGQPLQPHWQIRGGGAQPCTLPLDLPRYTSVLQFVIWSKNLVTN